MWQTVKFKPERLNITLKNKKHGDKEDHTLL